MKNSKKKLQRELEALEKSIRTFEAVRACGKASKCIVRRIDRMKARKADVEKQISQRE